MNKRLLTGLLYSLILGISQPASANRMEWLVLNPLGLELFVARADATAHEANNGRGRTVRSVLDTGISLVQGGYIADPDIASFNIKIEPTFTTASLSSWEGSSRVSDTNINYDASLFLLRRTHLPVSAMLRATKKSNTINGGIGAFTRYSSEEQSFRINWKNTYFPAAIAYRGMSYIETYISGLSGLSSMRENDTHSLKLEARSKPMSLVLEKFQSDDKVELTNNDFERWRGVLKHRLQWGHNSGLRTGLHYNKRTGRNPTEDIRWNESLNIRHTENLRSSSSYNYIKNKQYENTYSQHARFSITHNTYSNLYTEARIQHLSNNATNVNHSETQTGYEARYNKNDLFGMSVSAYLGGFYGDTTITSRQGLIEVTDEPNVIPLGGDVLLSNRYVVVSSVIVTDSSGVIVYTEGFDYELRAQTEGFTQLLVIPGGQLEPGRKILLSYSAETLPSSQYSTLNTRMGFNIGYRGLQFSYSNSKTDYTLKNGPEDRFLDDRNESSAVVRYQHNFSKASASVGMEHRNYKGGLFNSTSLVFTQSLSYAVTSRANINLSLNELTSKWSDNTQEEVYQFQFSLDWRSNHGLTLRPQFGAWQRRRTEMLDGIENDITEQFLTAGLDLRWSYHKLFLELSLRHNYREVNESNNQYDSVHFNFRRRFR